MAETGITERAVNGGNRQYGGGSQWWGVGTDSTEGTVNCVDRQYRDDSQWWAQAVQRGQSMVGTGSTELGSQWGQAVQKGEVNGDRQ